MATEGSRTGIELGERAALARWGADVLFVHTGGWPALFGYADEL
jgi:1-aminocyclopropane-1-carboxylate deaminase/D-cysteine desulfhydrase-like pyridoxal-dependent ACC family enzyme